MLRRRRLRVCHLYWIHNSSKYNWLADGMEMSNSRIQEIVDRLNKVPPVRCPTCIEAIQGNISGDWWECPECEGIEE